MIEERYVVDAMTVTLVIKNGVAVETECECEEYGKLEAHPMVSGTDERCKHIREAEMFAHFGQRVAPIDG